MPRSRRSILWFRRGYSSDRRRGRRSSPDRRRVNRVKFRRRYATARLKSLGEFTWIASRLAVVAGVLVWGAGLAWHAWQDSSYLRVQTVRFEGDIPIRLPATVPVKAGARLFSFSSRDLQQDELRRFPELASLSVHRTFDRALVLRGRFREPVALLDPSLVPTGIDPQGLAFPIPPDRVPEHALPLVEAAARDRAGAVACLGAWQKKVPAFFDVVKKLECDRMRTFHVELSDGVTVDLGTLDTAEAVDKGQKILRLLESFSPGKSPAHLKFVTEDRIVMDNVWKPREGGNNLVKN